MSEITVKGYVNHPKTISGGKGPFAVFTLAERQKEKDGTFTKVFFDCVDFNNADPPPESSFVTVNGWLSQKTFKKKDQTEGKGLSINVQKLAIAPPRDGAPAADPTKAFDDLPF